MPAIHGICLSASHWSESISRVHHQVKGVCPTLTIIVDAWGITHRFSMQLSGNSRIESTAAFQMALVASWLTPDQISYLPVTLISYGHRSELPSIPQVTWF